MPVDILVFELGGQRYGLPASQVRELVLAATVTPVPGGPDIIEGIVDIRGTVVPVLNVRQRLGAPARPIQHTDHLIVVSLAEHPVALHVDHASDLVRLAASDCEHAQGSLTGPGYVSGVAKLPGALVLILNLPRLLSDAESVMLKQWTGGFTER